MTQHLKSLIQMAFQNSSLNSASLFSSSIKKNTNSSEKMAMGKSTKPSDKLMHSNEKLKVTTPRGNMSKASSEYSCASNGSSSSSSSQKVETKLKMASIEQPANIPMTMRLISVTIGDVHEGGSFNDSANIKLSEAGFFFEFT